MKFAALSIFIIILLSVVTGCLDGNDGGQEQANQPNQTDQQDNETAPPPGDEDDQTPLPADKDDQTPSPGDEDDQTPLPADKDDQTPLPNVNDADVTGVNGPLRGRIIYEGHVYNYLLDLFTGESVRIADIGSAQGTRGSLDGQEIVHVDDSDINVDRIVIRDMDGRTVSSFTLSTTAYKPMLSPDRQTIAVFWNNEAAGERFDDPQLTLFTRNGDNWQRPFPEAASFDWMPDGRLIYASGISLYLSDLTLTESQRLHTLDSTP